MKPTLKYSLLCIFLLSCFISISQSEESAKKGLALGITFAPQFIDWQNDFKGHQFDEIIDSLSDKQLGFLVEINLEFEVSSKLSIKTGLGSSISRRKSNIIELNVSDPIIPSRYISWREISYFLELPVMLRYNLHRTDRWRVFIGAGIVNSFLFYNVQKLYAEYPETVENELISKGGSFYNNFYMLMAVCIEAGIAYNFNNRISASFFPSFEYSFIDISSRKQIGNRGYYLVGLNLGVVYHIK